MAPLYKLAPGEVLHNSKTTPTVSAPPFPSTVIQFVVTARSMPSYLRSTAWNFCCDRIESELLFFAYMARRALLVLVIVLVAACTPTPTESTLTHTEPMRPLALESLVVAPLAASEERPNPVSSNAVRRPVTPQVPSTNQDSSAPQDCHMEIQVTKKVAGECVNLGRFARGCASGTYLELYHPQCM